MSQRAALTRVGDGSIFTGNYFQTMEACSPGPGGEAMAAAEQQPSTPNDALPERGARMEIPADRRGSRVARLASFLPEIAVLAIAAYAFAQTLAMRDEDAGPGPAFFPRLLIGLLACAAVLRLVQKGIRLRRGSRPRMASEQVDDEPPVIPRKLAIVIALAVGYVLATTYLGWPIATFCLVVGFLYVAGRRKLWLTIPLGALTS
ncbi:MAG: hypothetical protein GEV04_24765, partial [Actinophytocola sp.]|nr:hypothetical protein [Actinophytocola sp.]